MLDRMIYISTGTIPHFYPENSPYKILGGIGLIQFGQVQIGSDFLRSCHGTRVKALACKIEQFAFYSSVMLSSCLYKYDVKVTTGSPNATCAKNSNYGSSKTICSSVLLYFQGELWRLGLTDNILAIAILVVQSIVIYWPDLEKNQAHLERNFLSNLQVLIPNGNHVYNNSDCVFLFGGK